jgi:anti-sigma factor RsiW
LDCTETRKLLPAHADRELGLRESMEVDRHLLACTTCQGELARQDSLRAGVQRHATYFAPPAHLEAAIKAALARESANAAAPPKRKWDWRWLNAGAALASVCAIAWSAWLYLAVPSANDLLANEVISSHVRSLMVDHVADVASSDQHAVKPWFNGKLAFAPPVSDFTAQGFSLVGGRLDYLDRQPVAALIYRHRQHLINLYAWPAVDERDSAPQALSRRGYHLLHWADGGMAYWVISDLNARELATLVQILRNREGNPAG